MKILNVNPDRHLINQAARHRSRTSITQKRNRSKYIEIIKQYPEIKSILCIGARHESEVVDFIGAGFKCVGIDLFTESKYILKMDMHHMNFKENEFDLIYASHVLEHSHNPNRLLKNISRISKFGVFVILPKFIREKADHPVTFDIMINTPDIFTGHLDFKDLGEYDISHYEQNDVEIEILFIFKT